MAKLSANGFELFRLEKTFEDRDRVVLSIRIKEVKSEKGWKLLGLRRHDFFDRHTGKRQTGHWAHAVWSGGFRGEHHVVSLKADELKDKFIEQGWTEM